MESRRVDLEKVLEGFSMVLMDHHGRYWPSVHTLHFVHSKITTRVVESLTSTWPQVWPGPVLVFGHLQSKPTPPVSQINNQELVQWYIRLILRPVTWTSHMDSRFLSWQLHF